jgi:uncharacterized protein DUF4124
MRILTALLLLVATAAYAQQVYRWTDKNGRVHYGANPPPGVAAKAVKDTTSSVATPKPTFNAASSAGGRPPPPGVFDKPKIDPKKQY